MTDHASEYWKAYYSRVSAESSGLDYSNNRVQDQSYSLMLEGAGAIRGMRVVDIGCGWGQLAVCLEILGAEKVTAVDIVPEMIERLRGAHPEIDWLCADLGDESFARRLDLADVILLNEVLQYVSYERVIRDVWGRVAPGGRLVAMVPNRLCPIIRSVIERFEGRYTPPTADELERVVSGLPGLATWGIRGLTFRDDQRIAPYHAGDWSAAGIGPTQANRLQFVAVRNVG